jgi:hypothetical protein
MRVDFNLNVPGVRNILQISRNVPTAIYLCLVVKQKYSVAALINILHGYTR